MGVAAKQNDLLGFSQSSGACLVQLDLYSAALQVIELHGIMSSGREYRDADEAIVRTCDIRSIHSDESLDNGDKDSNGVTVMQPKVKEAKRQGKPAPSRGTKKTARRSAGKPPPPRIDQLVKLYESG